MAVDIGSEAINRGDEFSADGYTIVDKNNPATTTGEITSIDIWARISMTGLKVGTFYTTNGNTLKCRDGATIGAVTGGSKQTFTEDSGGTPLAIAVEIGDYIGCYHATGRLELDFSGDGVWYKSGEYVDPNDEGDYTFLDSNTISLGGYIEGAAGGWTGKIIGVTNSAKVLGIAVADIGKVNGVS